MQYRLEFTLSEQGCVHSLAGLCGFDSGFERSSPFLGWDVNSIQQIEYLLDIQKKLFHLWPHLRYVTQCYLVKISDHNYRCVVVHMQG